MLAVTFLQWYHYRNHKLWNIVLIKRDIFQKAISDLNIYNLGTIFLTKNTFTFINPIMYQNKGQRPFMFICYFKNLFTIYKSYYVSEQKTQKIYVYLLCKNECQRKMK